MDSSEIVRKAIEFDNPPRLPFLLGENAVRIQRLIPGIPNDICDCWEMDRQKNGWFFDTPTLDDWGCGWETTNIKTMGQVKHHPLQDYGKLDSYRPPNPRDKFYFERLADTIGKANDRYVMLTSHFNLFERFHMLRGFQQALEDFYLNPEKCHKLLDMILEFKINQFDELNKRFGERVHGIFLTDDWGTQRSTIVSESTFKEFFFDRYKKLVEAVHNHNWHFILHSCGRVKKFIPMFIEAGVDVLNIQVQANGIRQVGREFAGRICFLETLDIQTTLPKGDVELMRREARELISHWSTPDGGFIVLDHSVDVEATRASETVDKLVFEEFWNLAQYWKESKLLAGLDRI